MIKNIWSYLKLANIIPPNLSQANKLKKQMDGRWAWTFWSNLSNEENVFETNLVQIKSRKKILIMNSSAK